MVIFMAGLFDTTAFRITEQGLKVIHESNKVISQNIANHNTPNYKAKYLYFEGVLTDVAAKREGQKYTKELNLKTAIYTDNNTKDQPDGNNVDNDTQEALLVKNSIMQSLLIRQMESEFTLLRSAMRKS